MGCRISLLANIWISHIKIWTDTRILKTESCSLFPAGLVHGNHLVILEPPSEHQFVTNVPSTTCVIVDSALQQNILVIEPLEQKNRNYFFGRQFPCLPDIFAYNVQQWTYPSDLDLQFSHEKCQTVPYWTDKDFAKQCRNSQEMEMLMHQQSPSPTSTVIFQSDFVFQSVFFGCQIRLHPRLRSRVHRSSGGDQEGHWRRGDGLIFWAKVGGNILWQPGGNWQFGEETSGNSWTVGNS